MGTNWRNTRRQKGIRWMIKFIHAADLHIDSPLVGLSAHDEAPSEDIRSATRRALKNLVALAIREQVDFVLIAGDVFDGDWPDYHTGLFFNARLAELHEAGIPVLMVSGNHDAASTISRHLTTPPNVFQFPVDHAASHLFEDLGVAVHGQGFAERAVRHNLVPGYPAPLPGLINIGVLHTSVNGQGNHETYAPCHLSELVDKGYDYWALGHIHKRQILHEHPWVVYSGNLQGRHIRETGPKGVMLVEIEPSRSWNVQFRSLDVLRWEVASIDLSAACTMEDLAGAVMVPLEQLAADAGGLPLAVRLELTGRTALHGTIMADLERAVSEVQNAANMAAPGKIWLEKVRWMTRPVALPAADRHHGDALAEIRRTLDVLGQDDQFIASFVADMGKILDRMPAYQQSPGAFQRDDPTDMATMLDEAGALLNALMADPGGEV